MRMITVFGPEEYTAVFGGKTRKVWVRLGGERRGKRRVGGEKTHGEQ